MPLLYVTQAIAHCGGIFQRKIHAFLLSLRLGGKNRGRFFRNETIAQTVGGNCVKKKSEQAEKRLKKEVGYIFKN